MKAHLSGRSEAEAKQLCGRRPQHYFISLAVLLMTLPVFGFAASSTRDTLSVESFVVDKKMRMTEHTVIAENGIHIKGSLLSMPKPNGSSAAFEITAKRGDIVIDGDISVQTPSVLNKKKNRAAAPSGASLIIIADKGDIVLGQNVRLKAGNGFSGKKTILKDKREGEILGEDGGAGGDIILEALNGEIRVADQFGSFAPGDGGAGGKISVDGNAASAINRIELKITAGSGGDSGNVITRAKVVVGLNLLAKKRNVITTGIGGPGGVSEWIVRKNQAGSSDSLEKIELRGGRGGSGVLRGGRGGAAIFASSGVALKKGGRTPDAEVFGGDGGDIISTGIRLARVRAGDGGFAAATGVAGRDAETAASPNGANGGGVVVHAGNGGSIQQADWIFFPSGRGGSGAVASDDAAAWGDQPMAEGGAGGKGRDSCRGESGAGGDGGEGGSATFFAGNGGAGPKGGRGGNSYLVSGGNSGRAGRGSPSGRSGNPGNAVSEVGAGGAGEEAGVPGEKFVTARQGIVPITPESC